jgi:hypothetical protein
MKVTDLQVVEGCYRAHLCIPGNDHGSWAMIMIATGAREKVVYAAMDRAHKKGLIEYGISLRTAWPSKTGLELLRSKPVENR